MRTSRNIFTNHQPNFSSEDHWSVTVVYEDTWARDRAQSLCQHLVQGFEADIDFAFNWWRFRYLADPNIARAAAQAAARADILLFSATNRDDLPDEVRRWTELWIPMRVSGEGVLLVLTEDAEDAELMASPLYLFLRNLASRASMDFLPRVSDEPWAPPPNDIRLIQSRATQGTRILDDILRQTPPAPVPPSHWGINE
jgi:hypothetical protein